MEGADHVDPREDAAAEADAGPGDEEVDVPQHAPRNPEGDVLGREPHLANQQVAEPARDEEQDGAAGEHLEDIVAGREMPAARGECASLVVQADAQGLAEVHEEAPVADGAGEQDHPEGTHRDDEGECAEVEEPWDAAPSEEGHEGSDGHATPEAG